MNPHLMTQLSWLLFAQSPAASCGHYIASNFFIPHFALLACPTLSGLATSEGCKLLPTLCFSYPLFTSLFQPNHYDLPALSIFAAFRNNKKTAP